MQKSLLVVLLGISSCALGQAGQYMSSDGPNYLIPDKPFQAIRITHLEQKLSDGNSIKQTLQETLARSTEGKFFEEITAFNSGPENQLPASTYVLADPVSHRVYRWGEGSESGVQSFVSAKTHWQLEAVRPTVGRSYFPKSKYPPKIEELGSKTIAGHKATGTATTITLPPGSMGNVKEIQIRHEAWISDEFDFPLLEIEESPLAGSWRSEVVSISTEIKNTSVFVVPENRSFRSFPGGAVRFGTAVENTTTH